MIRLNPGWPDARQAKYFYPLSANVYRFPMFQATPDTLQYIHGINEQVGTEDYFQAVSFYYHLIRQSMVAWPRS